MVEENRQFVLYVLWHLQPVQVAKKWRNTLEPPCREDETCSSILFFGTVRNICVGFVY